MEIRNELLLPEANPSSQAWTQGGLGGRFMEAPELRLDM